MTLLTAYLVNRIMISEREERKATVFLCFFIDYDVTAFDNTVVIKILTEVVLVQLIFNATNKDFLYLHAGLWLAGLLKEE